jgi:hypothetical protein
MHSHVWEGTMTILALDTIGSKCCLSYSYETLIRLLQQWLTMGCIGCEVVYDGRSLQTFRRNKMYPSEKRSLKWSQYMLLVDLWRYGRANCIIRRASVARCTEYSNGPQGSRKKWRDVMCLLWGTDKPIELSWVLNKRWIMSRIVTVILIYHRHKPIDSINLLGS